MFCLFFPLCTIYFTCAIITITVSYIARGKDLILVMDNNLLTHINKGLHFALGIKNQLKFNWTFPFFASPITDSVTSLFRDDVKEDRMAMKKDKFYSLEIEGLLG